MRAVAVTIAALALTIGVCNGQLVGAPVGADQNDPQMQERIQSAAKFAVGEIQKRCNCVSHYELDQVASARTQVVAGINYLMDVVVKRDGNPEVHHVVVYDRFGDMSLTKDELDTPGAAPPQPPQL